MLDKRIDNLIVQFKNDHADLVQKTSSFEEYILQKGSLLSATIRTLRYANIPGNIRASVNGQLQRLTFRRTREWLYARNQTCGICGEFINPEDITIDHIVPRYVVGESKPENKQLAHPRCNNTIKNVADMQKYGAPRHYRRIRRKIAQEST